jgi:hypothetical protein
LTKLKDRSEISEREYYYLRSHPKPLQQLEDKTLGIPPLSTTACPRRFSRNRGVRSKLRLRQFLT